MNMAMNGQDKLEEVFQKIANEDINFIRLVFHDINGIARSKLTPVRNFRRYVSNGISFPSDIFTFGIHGNVTVDSPMVTKHGFSDTLFFPYLDSFVALPWLPQTARVLVNPHPSAGKDPLHFSPFAVAEHQVKLLHKMGYFLKSAFEYEFWLSDAKSKELLADKSMIYSGFLVGKHQALFEFMDKSLYDLGIDVELIQTENSPSQFEVTYKPKFGVRAAIDAVTFRNAVKEICHQKGISASFMTKPWQDRNGCSAHFNHSLWSIDGSTSLMHNLSNPDELSSIASQWIAGLVEHAPALTILSAASSNCLLRVKPGTFAPTRASWGFDSRISAIRVKSTPERVSYVEKRIGASAGNPFITMAATIAAGIDGIKRKLQLPPPIETNKIYFDETSKAKCRELPNTVEDGLKCLQDDHVICEALGHEFINNFTTVKKAEANLRNKALFDGKDEYEWGREHYFERF